MPVTDNLYEDQYKPKAYWVIFLTIQLLDQVWCFTLVAAQGQSHTLLVRRYVSPNEHFE